MLHRILAVSAAAILPALLFTASPPAGVASSGVTVATGTITSPGGGAMPGVRVDLYTWPPDAVLSAMQPGQAMPRTLLATATTSSAGSYALQVQRPDTEIMVLRREGAVPRRQVARPKPG